MITKKQLRNLVDKLNEIIELQGEDVKRLKKELAYVKQLNEEYKNPTVREQELTIHCKNQQKELGRLNKKVKNMKDKPTYEQLEKAYNCMATDLSILWKKFKPNETYIKIDFIKKVYIKLGGGK